MHNDAKTQTVNEHSKREEGRWQCVTSPEVTAVEFVFSWKTTNFVSLYIDYENCIWQRRSSLIQQTIRVSWLNEDIIQVFVGHMQSSPVFAQQLLMNNSLAKNSDVMCLWNLFSNFRKCVPQRIQIIQKTVAGSSFIACFCRYIFITSRCCCLLLIECLHLQVHLSVSVTNQTRVKS